jgi:radical SAM protein with 4Fe4S-binding SPASM domain
MQARPRGITLIGGEPLLNAELVALVRRIARLKIGVALSTNAIGLHRTRIDELVRAGVTAFEVSYDSPDASTYARMTRSPLGPLQGTLTELVRAGVKVSVGAMLMRHNLAQLEELLQICFALGVGRVSLNQVAMVGAARDNPDMVPNDGELEAALEVVNTTAAALGMRVGIGLPLEPCRFSHNRFPALEFERCHCGDDKWLIEPSGDVRVCELAPTAVGNLLRDTWRDIVTSSEVQRFRQHRPLEDCETCSDWTSCGGGCRLRLPQSPGARHEKRTP